MNGINVTPGSNIQHRKIYHRKSKPAPEFRRAGAKLKNKKANAFRKKVIYETLIGSKIRETVITD